MTSPAIAVDYCSKPYRIACLLSHPTQYFAPLFRYLAKDPAIDLTVFFLSDFSLRAYTDPGFRAPLRWDVELLDGYRYVFLPVLGSKDRISFWKPFNHGLWSRLRSGCFEALWLHGYAQQSVLRALVLAKLRGIKVLVRGESHLDLTRRRGTQEKRAIMRRLFGFIDAFLAIGTRNHSFYRHYGVGPERIFMMPYTVDNDFFRIQAEQVRHRREELRAELNLDPGRPVILYASKMIPEKRPLDLLEAHALLLSDCSNHSRRPYLLFVGDGELRGELQARASKLEGSLVRFLGFRNQTELPRYYDLCDVFVLPSIYEPWGLVVNEVMNAGKPVIVSDKVGAQTDLVKDGENGFVVGAGDIVLLAQKLKVLTDNIELAAGMGKRSLEIISRWNFEADRRGLLEALAAVTGRIPLTTRGGRAKNANPSPEEPTCNVQLMMSLTRE